MFSFSNNSKEIKNSKISPLIVYSIFCIFEFNFKIRKMKKWSIFLTIFFFSILFCTLKYVNMLRISNISFFRFCWKNGKLDWPKCARPIRISNMSFFRFCWKNEKIDWPNCALTPSCYRKGSLAFLEKKPDVLL